MCFMTQLPEAAETVQQWLSKADEDLLAAKQLLSTQNGRLHGIVCYHAQQCAEKSVKAVLTEKGIDFTKTHDIGELAAALPEDTDMGISAEDQDLLTDYATTARYPGDTEPLTHDDADRAVAAAEAALSAARRLAAGLTSGA